MFTELVCNITEKMSFDDYVHLMSQKYRLAVAISVLKSKPVDFTVDQYILKLQDKFLEKMDVDDKILSICSDDFNFDDNDFNLMINEFTIPFDENSCKNTENTVAIRSDFDSSMQAPIENDADIAESNSLDDMLKILKGIGGDSVNIETNTMNIDHDYTQTTFCAESQSILEPSTSKTKQIDVEFHKNLDIINVNQYDEVIGINDHNNDTENTKSKNARMVATVAKNIVHIDNGICKSGNLKHFNAGNIMNKDTNSKNIIIDAKNTTCKIAGNFKKNSDHNSNKEFRVDEMDSPHRYEDMVTKGTKKIEKEVNKIDLNPYSQETEIYTLHGFTQNYSHVSQSQVNNFKISDNYIHGTKQIYGRNDFDVTCNTNKPFNADIGLHNDNNQTSECQIYSIDDKNINFNQIDLEKAYVEEIVEPTFIKLQETQYLVNDSGKLYTIQQTIGHYDKNTRDALKTITAQIDADMENNFTYTNMVKDNLNNKTAKSKTMTYVNSKITDTKEIKDPNDETTESLCEITEKNNKQSENADTMNNTDKNKSSQSELIPFKVIEEMNRLKSFLNKNQERTIMECSAESGYKSDSQKSFKNATQSNWLNQSCHCLHNYLMQCPLVASTQDITGEISEVLGKLIDKLHEEEKYPHFLEVVLDDIVELLKNIYEDDISENALLSKDETIHRLLLLNKSSQILKYTIEKLTNYLQKALTYLTVKDNLYELDKIEEIENLTYIFHILETLLPKYLNVKNSSQISETSQEDKILKKSSITDIWRKKWIPNYKEDVICEGSSVNNCVLKNLGQVLNKIIVGCIEGYSLVAYAALQCFNLLQN